MKRALITGASSGIGLAFARLLALKRYDLILVARRREKLLSIKKELEHLYKIKVTVIPLDLTVAGVTKALFDELSEHNYVIDVLINNAGFGHYGELTTTDWKKEEDMIQLNVVALTHLSKLYAKLMLKHGGGQILNVASTAAFVPGPYMSVYYATKAYVLSFTESLAKELEGTAVTVTALCPGPTKSEFASKADMNHVSFFKGKIPKSSEVAQYGYTAMMEGKTIAIYGTTNKLMIFFSRFLPRKLLANTVAKIQKK